MMSKMTKITGMTTVFVLVVFCCGNLKVIQCFHISPILMNHYNSIMSSTTSMSASFSKSTNEQKIEIDESLSKEVEKNVGKFSIAIRKSLDNHHILKDKNNSGDETFESLTLYGQNTRKVKNLFDNPELRGTIRLVEGRLITLKSKTKIRRSKKKLESSPPTKLDNLYLQMTIKYHGATDVAQNWKSEDVSSNLILLFMHGLNPSKNVDPTIDFRSPISSLLPQNEWNNNDNSLTRDKQMKDIHDDLVENVFQSSFPIFSGAKLVTSEGTWELTLPSPSTKSVKNGKTTSRKKQKVGCVFSPKGKSSNLTGTVVPLSHDVPKKVPLEPGALFFQKLSVTDAKGRARPGMASKLKQCQRFVEIVGNLVEKHIIENADEELTTLSSVDMGCGRGYLTFALHKYLSQHSKEQFLIKSRGIEMRPKLVSECNGIVQDLVNTNSSEFAGDLKFVQGTIEQSLASVQSQGSGENDSNNLDILIALHACDTATDDAIWYGIQRNSCLIITAPCCHKEIRSQIEQLTLKKKNDQHSLADILCHGIYRERMGEMVTDSLRALLLELANYQVQVFEFIGGEHTSKNVMITAVKKKQKLSEKSKEQIRTRIRSLAHLYGIQTQRLATWMGEDTALDGGLNDNKDEITEPNNNLMKKEMKKLRNRQMPPPPMSLDV